MVDLLRFAKGKGFGEMEPLKNNEDVSKLFCGKIFSSELKKVDNIKIVRKFVRVRKIVRIYGNNKLLSRQTRQKRASTYSP
jgi:hypothetical protein